MERTYAEYAARQAVELLAIDSPTGFTRQAAEWVLDAFRSLGYEARTTVKGGVLIDLGGSDENDGLLLEAHADTLGGMVAEIKGSGRLRLVHRVLLAAVLRPRSRQLRKGHRDAQQ